MFKEIKKKIMLNMEGNLKYQKFFTKLFNFSLRGMNIGGGFDVEKSGEKFILKYINKKNNGKKYITIFDVGANVGNYSIEILKSFNNENLKLYLFEPAKITFNKLKNNIKENENIKLYNFGFGNENNQLNLYSDKDGSGLASIYKRKLDHFNVDLKNVENVKIKKLDNFCAEQDIKHIDFLKLDVEGHELSILKGAKQMLDSGSIDYIQFEFGGCNIDSRTYFQDFWYLLSPKYKIYRILKNGVYEISKYRENYEIFINTNFLAIKK